MIPSEKLLENFKKLLKSSKKKKRKTSQMFDLFSILPLLEGWDYHPYEIPSTPVTTTPKLLLEIEKKGWILAFSLLTDDAYATMRLRWKGAGNLWFVANYNAETAYLLGATQQDPAGWIQLYNRPIPALTNGAYLVVPFSGGFQGSPFPYTPPINVEGYLATGSTQTTANLSASALVIEIIDEREFKRSLREFYRLTLGRGEVE